MAGEIDPQTFANATADYETLMWMMTQVKDWTRTPGLNRVIGALSREFFRRRQF